jgi:hypothetical protein
MEGTFCNEESYGPNWGKISATTWTDMKNLGRESRYPNRDSSTEPPKYKPGALPLDEPASRRCACWWQRQCSWESTNARDTAFIRLRSELLMKSCASGGCNTRHGHPHEVSRHRADIGCGLRDSGLNLSNITYFLFGTASGVNTQLPTEWKKKRLILTFSFSAKL